MKYFKLLDRENRNTVVKANGMVQHQYIRGRGWMRSAILTRYFNDKTEYYNSYEEITEDEAFRLIS